MGVGTNYVTGHAMERIRERWPSTSTLSHTRLLGYVAQAIQHAQKRGEVVLAPGGTYVPFTFGGEEGFLVIKKKSVVTAEGADWCPEVAAYLEKIRNGQV